MMMMMKKKKKRIDFQNAPQKLRIKSGADAISSKSNRRPRFVFSSSSFLLDIAPGMDLFASFLSSKSPRNSRPFFSLSILGRSVGRPRYTSSLLSKDTQRRVQIEGRYIDRIDR